MEMTLNLPRNYVEIEEEEMMYLEGGGFSTLGKNLLGVYNWISSTQAKGVGLALRSIGFYALAKNLAYGVIPGTMNYIAGIIGNAAAKLIAMAPFAAAIAIGVLCAGAVYLSNYRVFY